MSTDMAVPAPIRVEISFWFQRHVNDGISIEDVAFDSGDEAVTTEEMGRMLTILGASLRDRVRLKAR